jgi:hypothetical protein
MPFLNGKVCPPATSEAGARRQLEQYSSPNFQITSIFYFSSIRRAAYIHTDPGNVEDLRWGIIFRNEPV